MAKAAENQELENQAPAETGKGTGKSLYKVIGNLRHDGKGYAKGKTVYLTAKEAKPLLDAKVVAPSKEKSE